MESNVHPSVAHSTWCRTTAQQMAFMVQITTIFTVSWSNSAIDMSLPFTSTHAFNTQHQACCPKNK